MAQVDFLKLLGAAGDIPQTSQESASRQIPQSIEDTTKSQDQVRQENSNTADSSAPDPDLMEDDDVQLVLSVPRRRRKKRKRFNFLNSPLGQYQEIQAFQKEVKEEPKDIDNSPRRKSTSVVQRLESCHLREKEAGQRRGSLPVVPISKNTPVQLSWTHEPNFNHHRLPTFPLVMPWWEDSMAALPHAQMSSSNWVPWQQEDVAGKKRKFEGGWQDNRPRKQYRQSTQLSPRSNPVSMIGSRFNAQQQGMVGTFDRPMADHSTNMTWPSFDWEPYRIVNPQYVSPYTSSSMAMDITDSNHGGMSQHQPSFQDWTQHTNMFSHEFDPHQANCDMFSPSHSPVPELMPSPATYSIQQFSSRSPPQQPISVVRSQTPQPLTPSPSPGCTIPGPESHLEVNVAASSMTASTPAPAAAQTSMRTPEASDILRRPSLYKIPAWPPTSPPTAHALSPGSPVVPPTTLSCKPNATDSNRSPRSPVSTNSTTVQKLPDEPRTGRRSNAGPARGLNEPMSPSSSSPTPHEKPITASTEQFQVPRARTGRKHSPNLIVDIAETCQEIFPFAAVAERHSVPLQKVFDTFSGIIQLPLLRNADDRRRHGSLGKRRMKEYRDARRAMERAQEAERKAEMKALRAKVDEAAKKGQGQGQASGNTSSGVNGKGLLKTAILNSAGKNRGGGNA